MFLKKIEYKMGVSFIKLLLARVKSKSPKFYITLRWLAGILCFLVAIVMGLIKSHTIVLAPELSAQVMDICKQIGSGLSGVILFTWTGTTDPALIEKPVE